MTTISPAPAPARAGRLATAVGLALTVGFGLAPARGDRVELTDGRVLEGRFAMLPGVVVDPFAEPPEGRSGGEPIVVCDDGLTRTMVPKRRVVKAETGPVDLGLERIEIPQRVADEGRRVAAVGAVLEATPFDEFGRRILTLMTADGRLDVVQGVTEITPRWVRVEGLRTERPLVLDMRLATSSIPRDVLARIVARQIEPRDSAARLRVVRLLLQAERYEDASRELDAVLEEFPDLADLAREQRSLGRLAAGRLLAEIEFRGRAGQDRLAMRLLDSFPAGDADGETLEAVREARAGYRARLDRATAAVAALRERSAALADAEDRRAAEAVVSEIERELSFASLPRLATFERVGLEAGLPGDRAVALAVNGWLQAGSGENLKVALSAVRVRNLLRRYLAADDAEDRAAALAGIAGEEAGDAATVAALAAGMRPPLEPPAATAPGLHELSIPAPDGGEPIRCLVQLPPEYDPLRRYPAIVTLHGAGSTPMRQLEWWAGLPDAAGVRQGQATRHGIIVIAPGWGRPNQAAYEYSVREHAAVLGAIREATRRFAIDTDRVFLSGHSAGGDAAWDVAVAHPDLWAGLVAIAPAADRYVNHYWPNARSLPVYVVGGELDGGRLRRNAIVLDRSFTRGFDVTYVEYRGRGHEHFSDEILRILDWIGRKRRTFFPPTIDVVSLRPWDRFFWWLEAEGPPPRTVVLPTAWPPESGTRPLSIEGRTTATNGIAANCGAERVRIWLSPELVDFARPVTVTLDGRTLHKGPVGPDLTVLLEDLRLRADRQHPFWAVVTSSRGPAR
jgi:predicted esterase